MEPYRERIEDFMRRYGYEGNRVLRVLAVAVAILLAPLLALRASTDEPSADQDKFVRACGLQVPAEHRTLAKTLKRDCGILGPSATHGGAGDGN